jgi:exonuclease SbcC
MQFQRLSVKNWRCFEDESVRFEEGITVLYGNNGAGKSSLLEAAFFALYGTDALDTGTRMDDVVTTDEDTAEVTLAFAHRGNTYEVTREIRIRASTTQYAELTTPPGQPDLEQTSDIDDLIQQELRLNAEDFLNSAYVRQGDVTRLIEASPDERQRIIDNLLQMSKLERYRDRMSDIETGVGRVVDDRESKIQQLIQQIEDLDEERVRYRRDWLEQYRSELEAERSDIQSRQDDVRKEREEAKEIITTQSGLKDDVEDAKDDVEAAIEDLHDPIKEYHKLAKTIDEANTIIENQTETLTTLLNRGRGDVRIPGADPDSIVTEVRAATEADIESIVETEYAGRLTDSGTDPNTVATDLFELVESETDPSQSNLDEWLSKVDIDLPRADVSTVSAESQDDAPTMADTDHLSIESIEPVIDPEVSVDATATLVPTPGIDEDSETVDEDTVDEALQDTEETVNTARQLVQRFDQAASTAERSAQEARRDAKDHTRQMDEAVANASETLRRVTGLRRAQERKDEFREQLRDQLRESDFNIDASQDFETLHETLEAIVETAAERRERLEAEREHHRETATRLEGQIDRAEELLSEGKCPRCGQPVDDAPEVAHRDEWERKREMHRKRAQDLAAGIDLFADRKEQAETWAVEAKHAAEDAGTLPPSGIEGSGGTERDVAIEDTDLETLYETAGDYHLEARTQRREAAAHRREAALQQACAWLFERLAERALANLHHARARKALLERIETAVSDRATAMSDRDRAQRRRQEEREAAQDAQSNLAEAIDEHSVVAAEFDPEALSEARADKEMATTELDRLKKQEADLTDTIEALNNDIGSFESTLDRIETLKENRDKRQRELDALSVLREQVNRLETMFKNLRSDLRQQNVQRLEELLQEMFDTLYRNDAYADIELGKDYDATLIEKGGGRLPPSKLSGGESAVFNLALRGAIYRLLTEGFEDDVPMPPLILDEPTAHLDSGHVDRLDDVVEAMRAAGVRQTIVVSHDEELIDSADQRIEVRQQQGSNRSVAEEERGVALGLS